MIGLDHSIVRWLNHASQHQPLRALAIVSAKYLAAVPPLMLLAAFGWALARRDTPRMAKAGLAAAGAALALGANQVIGQLFTRARPYSALASVHALVGRSGDSSFYSDHTAIAVGTAIGVFVASRRVGIVALVLATVVGVGRIAVGAHYPTDVVGAAGAAMIAVWMLLLLAAPVQAVLDRLLPAKRPPDSEPRSRRSL